MNSVFILIRGYMTKQYSMGGFFIDLSRNQITQNRKSQTIAPKALAVLTYLAENQGKVVSHDELLDKVWTDTVVSPNTLQRSIAQLRKALGDDGKIQSYIKTHAKQGYSLECDVRWHDKTNSTGHNGSQVNDEVGENHLGKPTDKSNNKNHSRTALGLASIVAGIVVLSIIGYQYLALKQSSQLVFDNLRSLTATDDKEFDPTYTPDGQHIVFHRYLDKQCINRIWAKDMSTQRETQLTEDWGAYGSHSFSKDGKKLVFLATEACNQPVTQKSCYDLVSLDFEEALESPQRPRLILQCQNSQLKKPTWLNNNDIALFQKISNRWKLISYSISMNESIDLYDLEDGNLIDFAYSARDDLIAVISIHNDGEYYIEILETDGHILSSNQIERPQEIPKFRAIYPSFDPLNRQLIFSTGRQLFTLSYDGKIAKIRLPFSDKMAQPRFHPDGKRVLFIKGPYDSDIVLLPISQIAETNNLAETSQSQVGSPQTYSSFERTNLGEDYAVFQPGGQSIAFWSERSGEQQLWLNDGGGTHQLTYFPMDTIIRGIDWAADGKSLLVSANNVLTQVFLDSRTKSFALKYPVVNLFQWNSKEGSALLLVRIRGIVKFVEYDLDKSEIREIAERTVLWALKSEDGRLIYKDHMDQFWQPGPAEAQRIKPLDKQGARTKSFVIRGNVIYAINTENQLWSYNLDSDTFRVLGEVGEDVDHLTDIDREQVLMTVRVSAKKEVVELSLSE